MWTLFEQKKTKLWNKQHFVRMVAGSISDGVTGIFHWHNPFSRNFCPGVDSASNRNEYQEYFLTTFMSRNLWASTSWNPKGLSRPVIGLLYRYRILWKIKNKFCNMLKMHQVFLLPKHIKLLSEGGFLCAS
jgi:hypothetical protein